MMRFLGIVLLIFTVQSCIEPIDWQGAGEPSGRLVVEALITTEPGPHSVILRRTQGVIVDGPGPLVSGALVTLSDGKLEAQLTDVGDGLYLTDTLFAARVGVTYVLTIEIDGQVYQAEAEAERAAPLEPVDILPSEFVPDPSQEGYYFEMTYRSNFGVPRGYLYAVELELPENVAEYYPDGWVPPSWVERVLDTEDRTYADSIYYLHPGLEPPALFAYGKTVLLGIPRGTVVREKFYSMTDEHYAFIRAMLSESEWKGLSPFAYQSADVPANISNGALGWFAVSDVATIEQKVME